MGLPAVPFSNHLKVARGYSCLEVSNKLIEGSFTRFLMREEALPVRKG